MTNSGHELYKMDELTRKSILFEDGNPARYRLKSTADNLYQSESCRKITFGDRDTDKPHKIILMVGETGTGKTTLINTMINYSCGVKRKHKVWFEITDDQCELSQLHSQTSAVTVYGVYIQETSVDLTIIDTPGYGNTRDITFDQKIAKYLLNSCTSEDVDEIDAVCLIISTHQSRLSDRQRYIFDSVQSLFGRDIVDNIVLLFTHSDGLPPKNALTAIKEVKVKCAVDENNQPIYFLFDNCQSMPCDEESDQMLEKSWNVSCKGMEGFFKFLYNIKTKYLKLTRDVLQKRQWLQNNISKLRSCIEMIAQNDKQNKENKNFKYEVKVSYKESIDTDPTVARLATCCIVCEENCHYPGCGWGCYLSGCSVMKNNHCTVCTNKCHYTKHIKEAKIYATKTETKTDNVKKQKLEKELQELKKEKIKMVMNAFYCVDSLEIIALQTDPLFILQHIDFLIEKLKEINESEKAEALENIKKRKR